MRAHGNQKSVVVEHLDLEEQLHPLEALEVGRLERGVQQRVGRLGVAADHRVEHVEPPFDRRRLAAKVGAKELIVAVGGLREERMPRCSCTSHIDGDDPPAPSSAPSLLGWLARAMEKSASR